jgi:hypothetical protein
LQEYNVKKFSLDVKSDTYIFHGTCIATWIGPGLEPLVVALEGLCIVVVDIELVLPGGVAVGQVPPLHVVVLPAALVLPVPEDPVAFHVGDQQLPTHFCKSKSIIYKLSGSLRETRCPISVSDHDSLNPDPIRIQIIRLCL